MNPHRGIDNNKNYNKSGRTKAIAAAIPMAGILVAAAVLSGLSLINGYYYQPAIAQQNITGTNATTTTPPTTGGAAPSACAPTNATTTNATTTTGGAGGGNATTGTNATSTTAGGGGNQSTSEIRMHIEQACMAAQNNDTQGVLMNLTLALNALGNMTATADGEEEPDVEEEGGGTEEEGGGGTEEEGGGTEAGG
jgi:hypothetical protein